MKVISFSENPSGTAVEQGFLGMGKRLRATAALCGSRVEEKR